MKNRQTGRQTTTNSRTTQLGHLLSNSKLQQSQQLRLQLATQIADLYRCQLFLPGALKLWMLTSSSISIAILARRGFGLDWIRLGTKLPAELVSSQVASCKLLVDSCNLQRSIQLCTWLRCCCCCWLADWPASHPIVGQEIVIICASARQIGRETWTDLSRFLFIACKL